MTYSNSFDDMGGLPANRFAPGIHFIWSNKWISQVDFLWKSTCADCLSFRMD